MFNELKTNQESWKTQGIVLPKSGILVRSPNHQFLEVHPLTPLFDLEVDGRRIGYISRGHSFVMPEYRGQGHFSRALSELEQLEIEFFRQGGFDEYRQAVYEQMGIGRRLFLSCLAALKEPHHLEFWRLPSVAAYFMEHGYRLSAFCMSELRCRGMIQRESPEEAALALRNHDARLKGQMIFLLLRTAATGV